MAFDEAGFRQAAKAAGKTDEEIDAYLASKQAPTGGLSALAPAAERAVQKGEQAIGESDARTLTELAGGIAGAAVAGRIPGAAKVGQAVGRMAGAAVGGAASEAGFQAATGEQLDPGKMVAAGGRQAAFEGVGQVAMRAINRLIKPTRMPIEAGTEQAAQAFKEVGGEFLPHQLVPEHRGIGFVSGVAESGIGGAGRMAAAGKRQQIAVQKLSERTAEKLADQSLRELTDEEIGALLQDTLQGGKAAYEAAGHKMYQALDTSGVKVDMTPAVDVAAGVLKRFAEIKNVGKTGAASQMMKRLQGFASVDPTTKQRTVQSITFEQAQSLRSEIAAAKRQAKNPGERRAYAELVTAVDESMEAAAINSGHATLADDWRAANAFYKEGKRVFDNKFLARLLKEEMPAEKIGETIAASGNVTTIKQVQEALKYAKQVDPSLNVEKAMNAVRAGWFTNALATASTKGPLSGEVLATRLSNPKVQRTMHTLYTPEQREAIMQFAQVAKMTQASPKGGGEVLIKLTQAGQGAAVGAMLLGGSAASPVAVPILIAPNLLSRMLTNPKTASWLTRGAKLPLGSPARAGLATRILNAAVEIAQDGELTIDPSWQAPAAAQPGSPANMIQER